MLANSSPSISTSGALTEPSSIFDAVNAANINRITKSDLYNNLKGFFGTGNREVKIQPYDNLPTTTLHLADVYKGVNLLLSETLVGLVTQKNEWPTTIALPWVYSPHHNFGWTEYTFNNAWAGKVPVEGVPRLLTFSSRSFQKGTTRRGLAFQIEHGFWKTEAGRQQYARNFAGIKNAIQETANADVCNAISTARDVLAETKSRRGNRESTMDQIMEWEISTFAVVNRSAKGLDYALGMIEQAMSNFEIKPNMLIVPPGFRMYYQKLFDEKTSYWTAGPNGVALLKQGPNATGSIGNMQVFETRALDVSRMESPITPFLNLISTAEYAPMFDEHVNTTKNDYDSVLRSIMLWDETMGRYTAVTLRDAIMFSHRFDTNGNLDGLHKELADEMSKPPAQRTESEWNKPIPNPHTTYFAPSARALRDGEAGRLQPGVGGQDAYDAETHDFLLYKKGSGGYGVVSYFGLMETDAAYHEDFKNVAISCAGRLQQEFVRAGLQELYSLHDESENVPYNNEYFLHLVAANMDRQRVGESYGQPTAKDIVQYRCIDAILEMVPNAYGGLDLPAKTGSFMNWSVPPLVNNFPALRSLAAEANSNKGWDNAAARAKLASDAVVAIVGIAKQVFGSSVFISELNRLPWFQIASNETTALNTVFLPNRDGVFLRLIPGLESDNAGASPEKEPDFKDDSVARQTARDFVQRLLTSTKLDVGQLIEDLKADVGDAHGDKLFTFLAFQAVDQLNVKAITPQSACSARDNTATILSYIKDKSSSKKEDIDVLAELFNPEATMHQVTAANNLLSKILSPAPAAEPAAPKAAAAKKGLSSTVPAKAPLAPEEEKVLASVLLQMNEFVARSRGGAAPQRVTKADKGTALIGERNGLPEDISLSAAQYQAGVFIRAPMNSAARFAREAMRQQFPMALPSNPLLAHMVPLQPAEVSQSIFNNIISRPHYTNAPLPGATSTADAGIMYAIPPEVRDAAARTYSQNAVNAHANRGKPLEPERVDAPAFSSVSGPLSNFLRRTSAQPSSIPDVGPAIPLFANRMGPPREAEDQSRSYEEQRYRREGYDPSATYDKDSRALGGGDAGPQKRTMEEILKGHPPFATKFNNLRAELNEPIFVSRWKAALKVQEHLVRILYLIFLGCTTNADQWFDLIDNNVHTPCGAILWRQWIVRRMHQLPALRGGLQTGMTIHGNSSATMGDDAVVKMHYANVTFNMTALIREPRGVSCLDAAMASNYLYGRGVSFVMHTNEGKAGVNWNGRNREAGDIISTMVGLRDNQLPAIASIMGEFVTPMYDQNSLVIREGKNHYKSALYYRRKFGLEEKAYNSISTKQKFAFGQSNLGAGLMPAPCGFYATADLYSKRYSGIKLPAYAHTGQYGVGPESKAVFAGRQATLPGTMEGMGYSY
jgi:hypothetical protein